MKFILLLITCILSTSSIFSQITGKVIDKTNNQPLEYATVALFSTSNNNLITGGITNEQGVFVLKNLKKGTYYVEISFIGYVSKKIKSIEITAQQRSIKLPITALSLSQNKLNDVVITGQKATAISKIDRQIYNAKSFQNTQGGTATDVIKNLPSITTNGLGEISLRGSNGFVLLIDGKPIQGDPATFLNQLPANAIGSVEVITAPSAKYDPEGKGGILNIISNKGATDGSFAQININAGFPSIEDYDTKEPAERYGIDATYNYKKNKWNLSLGANYQRKDISGRREGNVFTIVENTITRFPSDGERSFDEENYSGRFTVDYTPNKNNDFSVGFYAGKREKARTADILYFDNNAITPVNGTTRDFTLQYYNSNLRIRRGDFVLGSFDYKHSFNNESKLSTSFLYEYTLLGGPTTNKNLSFPDTTQLIQDEINTNDNPLNGVRTQLDYTWKPFSFGTLETGYHFRHLDHKGDFFYGRRNNFNDNFQLVPQFSSEIDLVRIIHSGYAQLNGKKSNWEYAAGVRLEVLDRDLDLKDKTNTFEEKLNYSYEKLFPSAAIQYNFNTKTSLKAAYSKRVERPSTFKLNPFREREHSETLEQGDQNLLPEFIDLVEMGVTKKFKKGNSIFATTYFRHVENLVNRVNQIYTDDPIDPINPEFNNVVLDRIYSNVGTGRTIGLELGAQINPIHKWTNFIGVNVYNFGIDGFYDGEKIDTNQTQYSINANSTYKFTSTASLQFTFNYLSERQTAQGEDSQFYSPNLSFRKTFFDNNLVATLQWKNIDLGLLDSNEQRITTSREGEFFTTTNYVYEVDVVSLNLSYNFNKRKNRAKFIESEFGKKEF